jgi:hypothetical protein
MTYLLIIATISRWLAIRALVKYDLFQASIRAGANPVCSNQVVQDARRRRIQMTDDSDTIVPRDRGRTSRHRHRNAQAADLLAVAKRAKAEAIQSSARDSGLLRGPVSPRRSLIAIALGRALRGPVGSQ